MRDVIQEKFGGGDPSPVSIFVLGMPRFGTTLVEQVIASHPAVHGLIKTALRFTSA